MEEFYLKVKEEFLELCGVISVEELIVNEQATRLIEDIGKSLQDISLIRG